jgi:hypothetical protein
VLNANLSSKVDAFPFVFFDDVEKGGKIPIYSPSEVINGNNLPEEFDHIFVSLRETEVVKTPFSYDWIYLMADMINQTNIPEASIANVFILGCISRLMSDSLEFVAHFKDKEKFRIAYTKASDNCNNKFAEYMHKALNLKNIVLKNLTIDQYK